MGQYVFAAATLLVLAGCSSGGTSNLSDGDSAVHDGTGDLSVKGDLEEEDGWRDGGKADQKPLPDSARADLDAAKDTYGDNITDLFQLDGNTGDMSAADIEDVDFDSGDSGDGTSQNGCPQVAPPSPQTLACMEWSCEQVEAPECWACSFTPVEDDTPCQSDSGDAGLCSDGTCGIMVSPSTDGPFTWVEKEHELSLSGGLFGTSIPLTIFLPSASGSYPVVVFHHGFQLDPGQYSSYGERLASWGFVVVMPKMPGGVMGIGAPNHVELKGYLSAVLDWVEEDALKGTAGVMAGVAEWQKLGLAGHSLGGKISMLLASSDQRPVSCCTICR